MENIVIGIEGYVGTGKTSVCRKLLDKIPNSVLLHGGNIYRAITYGILKTGLINVKEDNNKLSSLNIKNIMDKLKLKIEIEDRESVVYIHDKKIEEKDLQSLETSIATSKISSYANNDKLYAFYTDSQFVSFGQRKCDKDELIEESILVQMLKYFKN